MRLQVVGSLDRDASVELDGTAESFAARYIGADGRTTAGLFANRPAEAAALRRALIVDASAVAA
jgi:hypothetical protein